MYGAQWWSLLYNFLLLFSNIYLFVDALTSNSKPQNTHTHIYIYTYICSFQASFSFLFVYFPSRADSCCLLAMRCNSQLTAECPCGETYFFKMWARTVYVIQRAGNCSVHNVNIFLSLSRVICSHAPACKRPLQFLIIKGSLHYSECRIRDADICGLSGAVSCHVPMRLTPSLAPQCLTLFISLVIFVKAYF
uniref:Uncharacterized protein n=1 Tax=Amblyomma parvum TaxID=251391 RepID=A0A023G0N0_AMBPA